jgi:hypothetical protein
MSVSGKGYSMEYAMRDKMVKVGLAATAVALAAGVSGAFGGVALAWGDGDNVHVGGDGGNGGKAHNECGAAAQIPIPILGLAKPSPQCFAVGGNGAPGGEG